MEQELRIGSLPADIEATLCLIREDIIASNEMFAQQKEGQAGNEMFARNLERERKIVACFFEPDEIDEVLLYWYIKQVDKYAADLEGDNGEYTYAAFKVYMDLRLMSLVRKQEMADKKARAARGPVNYMDMARQFRKEVRNKNKNERHGEQG